MNRNLSVRYCITHFSYWAAYSSAASFAATYLLEAGLSSGMIGILLAVAGILAGVTQPVLASLADRAKKCILPHILHVLSVLSILCFGLLLLPGWTSWAAGIVYIMGMWSSDAMIALLNALGVACMDNGYPINYGAGRGVGSAASAITVLVLGHIIAKFGIVWILLIVIGFRVIFMVTLAGYPKLAKNSAITGTANEICSVWEFFSRYKWFSISLVGITLLATFHVMTDSYMIAIMQKFGGNSSHVGTALFISSIASAPVIFCFSLFRKRLPDTTLLKICALSYLLKAVLFCIAPGIYAIYLSQLLQSFSYGFLAPVQVYYANAKVRSTDMVKGQAFISATYAIACSAGSLAGGVMLNFGVQTMLLSGVTMALIGTVILFLTLHKSDI